MTLASVSGTMRAGPACVAICFQVPAQEMRIIDDSAGSYEQHWKFEWKVRVNFTPEFPDLPAGDWLCRITSAFQPNIFRKEIKLRGFTEIVPPDDLIAPRAEDLAYFVVTGENVSDKGSVGWFVDRNGKGVWKSRSDGIKPNTIAAEDVAQIVKYRSAWTYILARGKAVEVELLIPYPPKEGIILKPSSLATRLWAGLGSELHTDCTVVSCDGKQFLAHRFILASASSVFRAMFDHDMQEKRSGVCQIDDMDGNVLGILLEFLYTDRADPRRIKDIVEEIFDAADKYAVAKLRAVCENIMADSLSAKTAIPYLTFAVARGLDTLKMRAIKFLNDNAAEI